MKNIKKGNAGIVFLICALFVVIIAMGVFMLLDKTGSSNSGDGIEVNNGENTNISDKTNTNTNSYANFLANAKKTRETNTITAHSSDMIKAYSATLEKNGELYVEDELVATDVVLFYILWAGNAGYEYVYYITEDGSVYSTNSGLAVYENTKIESEKLDFTRIVNIVQASGTGAWYPVFIDCNGNFYIEQEKQNYVSNNANINYDTFLKNIKELRREHKLSDYVEALHKDYYVELKQDGSLYVDDNLVDVNVVYFETHLVANGGYGSVFFVRDDGTVWSANCGYALDTGEEIKNTAVDAKNVVSIVQASTPSASYSVYIDINGNAYLK